MNSPIEPFDAENQSWEYSSVIEAADDALDHLNAARQELNKAANWGLYDMMGGGMFGSLIKRNKLQNANREIEQAKRAMLHFSQELEGAHIDANAGLHIDLGDFWSLSDIFLDNFFSDMMMQQRIGEAMQQVDQAIRQVEYIRNQLC